MRGRLPADFQWEHDQLPYTPGRAPTADISNEGLQLTFKTRVCGAYS
jgi:hypothetical protein